MRTMSQLLDYWATHGIPKGVVQDELFRAFDKCRELYPDGTEAPDLSYYFAAALLRYLRQWEQAQLRRMFERVEPHNTRSRPLSTITVQVMDSDQHQRRPGAGVNQQ